MAKVISVLLTIISHVNGLSVPIKKPVAEWTSKGHIEFLQGESPLDLMMHKRCHYRAEAIGDRSYRELGREHLSHKGQAQSD